MAEHSYAFEEQVSGLWSKLMDKVDTTSYALFTKISLNSAGAAGGPSAVTCVVNLSKWKENTLYVDSSCALARAQATGLTISIATRPASAIAWQVVNTYTGCDESGLTIMPIVGSGIADTSGMKHFGDVRILIDNISDSGSATVLAWMFSRTPV
jgi:hypothetical protein